MPAQHSTSPEQLGLRLSQAYAAHCAALEHPDFPWGHLPDEYLDYLTAQLLSSRLRIYGIRHGEEFAARRALAMLG